MTAHGSLFERLGGLSEVRRQARLDEAVVESVATHLAKMLRTRAGSVQTLPDYGIPDLNNMTLSLHDAMNQSRKDIERFIETYEPRLSGVTVEPAPNGDNPLRLAFTISGLLKVNGSKSRINFVARFNDGGEVKVT